MAYIGYWASMYVAIILNDNCYLLPIWSLLVCTKPRGIGKGEKLSHRPSAESNRVPCRWAFQAAKFNTTVVTNFM
jgi:hypothetical protein